MPSIVDYMNQTLPFTIVGDVHGNLATLHHAAVATLRAGLTTMIQVGDFWCYEPRDLRKADRMLDHLAGQFDIYPEDLQLYFCDGNHENFDILNPDATEPVTLGDHFTYIPRGLATTIHGTRVGFLGGAESIDKDLRLHGRDWWPEETMTYHQIQRALDMGPVDILITHDTTLQVFEALAAAKGHAADKNLIGLQERHAIGEVLQATQPRWLLHGHHHTFGVYQKDDTTVVALAADGQAGAVVTLDHDGAVTPLPEIRAGKDWVAPPAVPQPL